MSKKSTKELLSELEELEGLGAGEHVDTSKAPATASNNGAAASAEDDLAEMQKILQRPTTPRISSSATSTRTRSPAKHTPPSTGSNRSSGDAASYTNVPVDKGGDAPEADTPRQINTRAEDEKAVGGSWWGGLSAFASAAVKQAEAAVKEIQKNEEAQRWAEQMKGNYGVLRGFGDELRSRAIPTFTTLLHTIAPPISQHERLQIHITHDFVDYPSLDPLVYQTFSRVMAQVEGGDLMVIQRGSESSQRRSSEAGYTGSGISGWNDGPWWREQDSHRSIGAVKGLVEGTKLVRASAEAYAHDFFTSRGGVEEAAKQATAILSESNPVRSSDIFLAIQAISHTAPRDYFGGSSSPETSSDSSATDESIRRQELVCFAIYLHDPIHTITFSTLSQSFPQKWADWLDAESKQSDNADEGWIPQLPQEILDIIQSGGVDPREWVAEWMEETIALAVGVVAQRYVAKRMGVGEASLGRGKPREPAIDSGAGEAARAL